MTSGYLCHDRKDLQGTRGTKGLWGGVYLPPALLVTATLSQQRPLDTFKHKIVFYLSTKATRDHFWFCFYAFFPLFFLEGIYICIYLQPCWYLHSQEYSVRNTKVLRKKLLKISSRLQENYFHMVRPESPVLVIQRQLRIVLCQSCRFRSPQNDGHI